MEPSNKQLIIERIIRVSLFLAFFAGIIWLVPDWVSSYHTSKIQYPDTTTDLLIDVKPFIEAIELNAISEETQKNVTFIRYMTQSPQQQAHILRNTLIENEVENYHIAIDDADHEIYIYNLGILQYRILFVQEKTAPAPPKDRVPMIAVVIGGLGFHNDTHITEHKEALTLAFSPKAPFSVSLAKQGGTQWHEIVVDTREMNTPKPETILPFASGVLSSKPLQELSPNQTSLYPSTNLKNITKNPLPLLIKKHLDIPSLIIRGKEKAIQNGFAGILIERDDPELQLVLDWTMKAKKEGYLIVMASELRYRNEHLPQEQQAPTKPE